MAIRRKAFSYTIETEEDGCIIIAQELDGVNESIILGREQIDTFLRDIRAALEGE